MFQSVVHMLLETVKKHGDKDALRYRRGGKLKQYTYRQFEDAIRNLTHGLATLDLQPGDKAAILSNNRPEWTISDFAAFALRAVVVPIYQTLPPGQIAYILNDSKTRAVFVEDRNQLDKIREIKAKVPTLEKIIVFEEENADGEDTLSFSSVIGEGRRRRQKQRSFFDDSIKEIDPEDICSLVYTSGTTGEPKGVMLHHKGFVTDIVYSEAVLNLYSDDVFLSFLPLSHLYERLAGHWCPMYRGATIHYAQSIDTVVEDIADARPTVMVSVPRLYEKIASRVQEQVEQGPAIKRKLFYWAVGTGLEYHDQRQKGKISPLLKRSYRLAEKLVFRKITNKLGGRFRYPIAGGAPLSVETLKFFEAIGLPIIEGYGMTETHLILTLTPPGQTRYGSCGKPIECIDMKIADDGEILVRGDILMKGYFGKPELTEDIIDAEGWLHTGDIGYLDEDQFLFITDRKKNIIVTAGGKNVTPAPIEHRIKTSKYIDDVCLVGNKRKYISAVIIPNEEMLKAWAAEKNMDGKNWEALCASDAVQTLMGDEIRSLQADFARYEQVKNFTILEQPLSIEKGELTPSLKIKRNVVEQHYKDRIDAMYRSTEKRSLQSDRAAN